MVAGKEIAKLRTASGTIDEHYRAKMNNIYSRVAIRYAATEFPE